MEHQPGPEGKKIFFLYPHSVIRDKMLDTLIMAGFETYTLVDEKRALRLLVKFPGSIMFINIDEGLKETEWEAYIKSVMEDPRIKDSRLGIMSYNQDRDLMRKYLMELAVPCGFVQLKLGLKESTKIILGALAATEARGRRKFIRADCHDDINASMNYKSDSGVLHGKLLDISSAGVAVRFEKPAEMPVKTLLRNTQLKLRGGLVMADMIFVGQRHDDTRVHILLFGSKQSTDDKLVIHRYIKLCLQKYIDTLKV